MADEDLNIFTSAENTIIGTIPDFGSTTPQYARPPKYRCNNGHEAYSSISVSAMNGLTGAELYRSHPVCAVCYAQWIERNVPRAYEMKDDAE